MNEVFGYVGFCFQNQKLECPKRTPQANKFAEVKEGEGESNTEATVVVLMLLNGVWRTAKSRGGRCFSNMLSIVDTARPR